MNQDVTFRYTYSAKRNAEVQEIRRKYLPREENKLEELKRLDNRVQTAGMAESLGVGLGGGLLFCLGLCLAMGILGNGVFLTVVGVLMGIIGLGGMLAAYPVYRRVFNTTKQKLVPRILELTAELSGEEVKH